ncbi:palmitoyltransferase ZDHHC3, partial [Caerostris extrusa]
VSQITPLFPSNIDNSNDLETAVVNLTTNIITVYNLASKPLHNKSIYFLPPPIKRLITQRNRARKNWQKFRDPFSKHLYSRAQAILRKEIKICDESTWATELNFLLVCESRRNNRGIQRQASVLNLPELSTDTNNCHCWNRLCAVIFVIFQTLAFLAITSHLRTMFSDPGAVPRGNATKETILQMGLCEGQVIYKCPKRKKSEVFCSFTFYIALISSHAFFLAISHFIMCVNNDWNKKMSNVNEDRDVCNPEEHKEKMSNVNEDRDVCNPEEHKEKMSNVNEDRDVCVPEEHKNFVGQFLNSNSLDIKITSVSSLAQFSKKNKIQESSSNGSQLTSPDCLDDTVNGIIKDSSAENAFTEEQSKTQTESLVDCINITDSDSSCDCLDESKTITYGNIKPETKEDFFNEIIVETSAENAFTEGQSETQTESLSETQTESLVDCINITEPSSSRDCGDDSISIIYENIKPQTKDDIVNEIIKDGSAAFTEEQPETQTESLVDCINIIEPSSSRNCVDDSKTITYGNIKPQTKEDFVNGIIKDSSAENACKSSQSTFDNSSPPLRPNSNAPDDNSCFIEPTTFEEISPYIALPYVELPDEIMDDGNPWPPFFDNKQYLAAIFEDSRRQAKEKIISCIVNAFNEEQLKQSSDPNSENASCSNLSGASFNREEYNKKKARLNVEYVSKAMLRLYLQAEL